tara:strand:+ start:133 stop:423 length:291 start_codon:yes stop_codon:yes gene_type:complete
MKHYDGEKEIINGEWNGLVWRDKYNDYVIPDLDEKKEYYAPIAAKNIEVCYTCDRWKSSTRQCLECGCFMDAKRIVLGLINKSLDANIKVCPLDKW